MKIIASTDKEVYGIGEEVKLTGKVSTFTAQSSYEIILTDPNGKTSSKTAAINNSLFSWSWTIPDYTTTFGIYKITVRSDSDEINSLIDQQNQLINQSNAILEILDCHPNFDVQN